MMVMVSMDDNGLFAIFSPAMWPDVKVFLKGLAFPKQQTAIGEDESGSQPTT